MMNKISKKYQRSAFIDMGGIKKRIDVDAIVFIEAQSYKCVFNMEDGTKFEVSMPNLNCLLLLIFKYSS